MNLESALIEISALKSEREGLIYERDFARRKFEEAATRHQQEVAELKGGLGVAQARIKVLENAVLFHAEDADNHRNRSIDLAEALKEVMQDCSCSMSPDVEEHALAILNSEPKG